MTTIQVFADHQGRAGAGSGGRQQGRVDVHNPSAREVAPLAPEYPGWSPCRSCSARVTSWPMGMTTWTRSSSSSTPGRRDSAEPARPPAQPWLPGRAGFLDAQSRLRREPEPGHRQGRAHRSPGQTPCPTSPRACSRSRRTAACPSHRRRNGCRALLDPWPGGKSAPWRTERPSGRSR